jgi:hypothetical protein
LIKPSLYEIVEICKTYSELGYQNRARLDGLLNCDTKEEVQEEFRGSGLDYVYNFVRLVNDTIWVTEDVEKFMNLLEVSK